MANMSEQEILEFQDSFNLFDNKGDGKIYGCQLGEVLRAIGENPTEAEVRKHGFSSDQDKRITFEQFIPILATTSKNRDTSKPEDFIEGFRVFDKEQNGLISSAELRHLLTHLGERLKDDDVEQLLVGQEDPQGNVNYEVCEYGYERINVNCPRVGCDYYRNYPSGIYNRFIGQETNKCGF